MLVCMEISDATLIGAADFAYDVYVFSASVRSKREIEEEIAVKNASKAMQFK